MFSDYIQRGAISKAQFDKSLVVLTVKMGMSGLVDLSCYNDFIQGESLEWKIISIRSGNRSNNDHIGKRSRYGYYKFFVSEEAKNDLLEYAPIARRKCDTLENHLMLNS